MASNGTLFIENLQQSDAGLFTCIASSESGNTSWSATLSVSSSTSLHQTPDISALPQNPSKPRIVNITSNSVTLTWSPGHEGQSKIIGYNIEYFSSNLNTGWVVAATGITDDTYTVSFISGFTKPYSDINQFSRSYSYMRLSFQVTELKPDTTYVFFVRAENSHGLSLPGPLSDSAHTTSVNQNSVPQIVLIRARDRLNSEILHLREVQPLTSTSVKIMWDVSIMQK